jgi:hypothetical protein
MSNNFPAMTDSNPWEPASISRPATGARSASSRWVRSYVPRQAPRVSMLTGSALVAMSLFLPFAYDGCGSKKTGSEFISGEGTWMGMPILATPWGARAFYTLTLGFAALSIALVLVSYLRPQWLRSSRLTCAAFGITGATSLFVIANFSWAVVLSWADEILSQFGCTTPVALTLAAAVTLLILGVCLCSKVLRAERWIIGLFGIAGALCLLVISDFCASRFLLTPVLTEETTVQMMAFLPVLYWLVPTGLWWGFGLSGRNEMNAEWTRMRSRIFQLFVPAAAIDCYFMALAGLEGLWGLVAFFVGIQMLALGYMQLVRQPDPVKVGGQVRVATEVLTQERLTALKTSF